MTSSGHRQVSNEDNKEEKQSALVGLSNVLFKVSLLFRSIQLTTG